MLKGVVRKIFFSIVGLFIFLMTIQLLIQNFFLEDIYFYIKKNSIKKEMKEFVDDYEYENWTYNELNKRSKSFSNKNQVPILVMNENNEILNIEFLKGFNYIVLKGSDGKYFNVMVDFLINEEGDIRYENLDLNLGETIQVKGIRIRRSNWIEPLTLTYNNVEYSDNQVIDQWKEFYGSDEKIIENIKGEIVHLNNISRDDGIFSYQKNKLWTESKMFIVEYNKNNSWKETFVGQNEYRFMEEGSGQEYVVINHIIEKIDGRKEIVLLLFTLENFHYVFKILNSYYLYFYLFGFIMILFMSYFFTKWLTKPLLHLNDVAKSIANLNFSKKAQVNTNDELEELSDNLNRTSFNLKNTIEKLKKSNQLLAEEAQRKSEEEKRMRNLMASLSHEFKTPLGIISGFMEILKDGINEKNPDYYIDVVNEEIERLNQLVLETIELSKLESGNYKLNIYEFDIKESIEKVCGRFEKHFAEKKLFVHKNLHSMIVKGDCKKIEQVLMNLISNAIRYSGEGKSIYINTEVKENEVFVNIENTGSEISQEELNKIWNRFYRTEKSRNRSLGGSGLGLAIVKNILELHGSEYGVDNTEIGVKFYFTLDNENQLV